MEWRFFDASDEYAILERISLPHWGQANTLCFITWRTWDSIPSGVLRRWVDERSAWLRSHGICPESRTWRFEVRALRKRLRYEFNNRFVGRFQDMLDDCRGACVLRAPELAKIVGDNLLHARGENYHVTDFVVMPNHVHLLAAFPSGDTMVTQCRNWKHYQAVALNRHLGRRGRFWLTDSFDHLVRSEAQYRYLKQYIRDNPKKARLKPEESLYFTA